MRCPIPSKITSMQKEQQYQQHHNRFYFNHKQNQMFTNYYVGGECSERGIENPFNPFRWIVLQNVLV